MLFSLQESHVIGLGTILSVSLYFLFWSGRECLLGENLSHVISGLHTLVCIAELL